MTYNYTLEISVAAKNGGTALDDIHTVEIKADLERRIRELDQTEHGTAKAAITLTQI